MDINTYLKQLITEFESINRFHYSILILLGLALLIQFFYYLFVYSKLKIKNTENKNLNDKKPVSVVICARNEAENLENFLPEILKQDYPNFEVIVVNDCSVDNTEEILSRLKNKYSNLYITNIRLDEKFTHGKKLALTIGIKAAKNDYLLLTDADCKPDSDKWIESMQQNFDEKKEIVLSYGGYFKEKGLTNLFIRTDTAFIAMQYLTFAKIGFPYMGVGRNMAYKKELFFKNNGFAKHSHLNSGDDDLFINEVAKKSNTCVELSPQSYTRSVPAKTFKKWRNQKKRHLQTGKLYKTKYKFLLGGELFSRFIFLLSLIILFFSKIHLLIFVAIFVFILRTAIQLIIFNKATKLFNESKISAFYILYDIIQPLINLSLHISNTFRRKKKKWR